MWAEDAKPLTRNDFRVCTAAADAASPILQRLMRLIMSDTERAAAPEQTRVAAGDLHGRYANFFDIGVNSNELVIDFGQFYGRGTQPTVHTRIVTTPAYGRELLDLLARSIGGLGERR